MAKKGDNNMAEQRTNAPIKPSELDQLIIERRDQIIPLIEGWCSFDQFKMAAIMAVQSNPELRLCHPQSLFFAIRDSAHKQLMPDGVDGVITHYDTRDGRLAKFNPMYQGLLRHALADPAIRKVETNAVHENDEFDYVEGTSPEVRLKKALKNRGDIIGAYCLITLANGEQTLEILDQDAGLAIKKQSAKKGVWSTAFEPEMWRKAVLRRALKWTPLQRRAMLAIGTDADELSMIEGGSYQPSSERQHPDNASVTSEPPNPNQISHQQTTTMKPIGNTIEGEVVGRGEEMDEGRFPPDERSQSRAAEQQAGSAPSTGGAVDPDRLLKDFEDEIALCDTGNEIDAAVDKWRPTIEDMMPPDQDSANKIVEARRKKIGKA